MRNFRYITRATTLETDLPFLPLHDDNPRRWVSTPYVTWGIILFCTIIYIWQTGLSPADEAKVLFSYGFIPAVVFGYRELADSLAVMPADFSVVTSVFLHGDAWHLIGNMLFLYIFGDNVEDACGHWRFAIFFVITGAVAALAQGYAEVASEAPLIGASGAVSGVLGAYILLTPKSKITVLLPFFIPIRLKAWAVIGSWFMFQTLASGGLMGAENVAYIAHVGGFLSGALLIGLIKRPAARLFAQ